MKRSILAVILLTISHLTLAQWQTIASNTSVRGGLYFLDALTGIGINGQAILRTIDGGRTWVNLSQQMGTTWGGDDISFTNGGSDGYIVIDNTSSISFNDYYFTTDSGKTWQSGMTFFNEDVAKIQFTSADTGYVMTPSGKEPGEIYGTVDGTANWNTVYTGGLNTRFSSVKFIDNNIGFLAGYREDSIPIIFRTYNGGTDWDSIPVDEKLPTLLIMDAVDPATVYLGSLISGKIYKSTDSCNTWKPIFNDSLLRIKQIKFPTPDTGYFAAYDLSSNKDVIFRSTDSGNSWQGQSFDGFGITDMFFLNGSKGWVCGVSGSIASLGMVTTIRENEFRSRLVYVYPNPFNQSSILKFNNPTKESHTLILYDSKGRLVRTITGIHTERITIKKDGLSNGLYFFYLSNDSHQTQYAGKFSIK